MSTMASKNVSETSHEHEQATMPDNNAHDVSEKKTEHKRALSDPSCTHDQLTKRLRLSLPLEKFFALIGRDKSGSNGVGDSNTGVHSDDGNTETRAPDLDDAISSVAVIVNDEQHQEQDNAAPTASVTQGSRDPSPDLLSGIEGHIEANGHEALVEQEDGAVSEQLAVDVLPATSASSGFVADGAMNPQRAAMIAATAPSQQGDGARFVDGGGPQKTGINKMPLGLRMPETTAQLNPAVQTSRAHQLYGGPHSFTGTQAYTRPRSPPYPGVPQYPASMPYQLPPQYGMVPYYMPMPPYGNVTQFNGFPQSMQPTLTKSQKRKMARKQSEARFHQIAQAQQYGFAMGAPVLPSSSNDVTAVNCTAQQGVIWEDIKMAIRDGINKIHPERDHGAMERDKTVSTVLNLLKPIILGGSMPRNSDGGRFDNDAPPSDDDAKPILSTHH